MKTKEMNPFDYHQITIAKKTLKMNDVGILIMGGMNKQEAREILKRHGIRFTE